MTAIHFDRLLVLFNPSGTNAARAKKIIAQLEREFPGKVITAETAPTVAGNVEILRQHLQPGDIVLPCGGDGTLSSTVAALLDPVIPGELRNIRILPVGTGRANDIARMTNGKHYADPLFVLRHGHELPVHPVSCVATPLDGGESVSWLAMYQLGFGFSGEAAGIFSDPKFRGKQSEQTLAVREVEAFRAGIQIVRDASHFDITLHGRRRGVIDITFVNGPIFASYYRAPVRLSDKEFCYAVSTDNSLASAARTIFELVTNTFNNWTLADHLSFTLHQPIAAHIDGERITMAAPCKITVTHSDEAITMLAVD